MDFQPKKAFFQTEAERLINYQHQHRGIKFTKLFLPPTIDREVNLVGQDDHIYRGRIPKVSEDQLPPEVDESSLNEVKLYQEIKDMDYPPVPQQEPLGPSRRIEGSYTLSKKLILAPVKVHCDRDLEEYQILGRDGGIYRGKERNASKMELDKQIRGTKRSMYKTRQQSKSAGIVEPSVVTLQGKYQVSGGQASSVKIPIANVREILAIIKQQHKDTSKATKQQKMTVNEGENTTATEQQVNKEQGGKSGDLGDSGKVQDFQEKEDIQKENIQDVQENSDENETENINESLEMQDAAENSEIDEENEPYEAKEIEDTNEEIEDIEDIDDANEEPETEDGEESEDINDENEESAAEDKEEPEDIDNANEEFEEDKEPDDTLES